MSRVESVTRYSIRLGDGGSCLRFTDDARDHSLVYSAHLVLVFNKSPHKRVLVSPSPRLTAEGYSLSLAKITNVWRNSSISPYVFITCCSIQNSENFQIIWNRRVIVIKSDISPSHERWIYSPSNPSSHCCDPWKMGILTSHTNEAPSKIWHELCLSYSLSQSFNYNENRKKTDFSRWTMEYRQPAVKKNDLEGANTVRPYRATVCWK